MDPRAAILDRAERDGVKFLRLQFTDILGAIKNVEVPDRQFAEALDGGVLFDGSSIEGGARGACGRRDGGPGEGPRRGRRRSP